MLNIYNHPKYTAAQLAFYCGWPKAWSVFPLVEEVYDDERGI